MISVEDLDHDKICRLKETYALRSFRRNQERRAVIG